MCTHTYTHKENLNQIKAFELITILEKQTNRGQENMLGTPWKGYQQNPECGKLSDLVCPENKLQKKKMKAVGKERANLQITRDLRDNIN